MWSVSGTPVSVAAAALRTCAMGDDRASLGTSGLAVQIPVIVMAHMIRVEAMVCGSMFVLSFGWRKMVAMMKKAMVAMLSADTTIR